MSHILVFGAGKSSVYLISYLVRQVISNNWQLTVLDADVNAANEKLGTTHANISAAAIRVEQDEERASWIGKADIVISLLPPSLHYLVARDCVQLGKNLLTASYIDEQIGQLRQEIERKGLLFLCEMGLDPGIDHMSALKMIRNLQQRNVRILSFESHCGGLVAPESDDNPWHYKISWNPRNVVLAGKAGAVYRENGGNKTMPYEQLFDASRTVQVAGLPLLAYYPNRDSLHYIDLYQLHDIPTFIRTTLRYPEFCAGWKYIVEAGLTSETPAYDTDGMTLQQFFHEHYAKTGLSPDAIHDAQLQQQLQFLGASDNTTYINKGRCSAADVLQFALEKKLVLRPGDKDMIVMLHEIRYEENGREHKERSTLVVKGEDHIRTAMAKTVGLPLAIAATMILKGKIKLKGLHIPVLPDIYEPVLTELEENGIRFIHS